MLLLKIFHHDIPAIRLTATKASHPNVVNCRIVDTSLQVLFDWLILFGPETMSLPVMTVIVLLVPRIHSCRQAPTGSGGADECRRLAVDMSVKFAAGDALSHSGRLLETLLHWNLERPEGEGVSE